MKLIVYTISAEYTDEYLHTIEDTTLKWCTVVCEGVDPGYWC